MNENRFASIGRVSLENYNNGIRRRILNDRNIIININNNSIYFNNNKMKVLILFVITIIMSLSNYFYKFNNIQGEPMTILNIFKNKIEPILDNQGKVGLRNLIEENEEENQKGNEYNEIIRDIIDNFFNISNTMHDMTKKDKINENHKNNADINIKRKFLFEIDKYIFKCNWKSIKNKNNSIYTIGDYSYGKGIFTIKRKAGFSIDNQFIVFTMKNNEGKFIDNWILHSSISNLENLFINVNNKSNTFEIIGSFQTTLYNGEFFSIKNEDDPEYCKTNINMFFPLYNQTYLNNNYINIPNFYKYEDIKLNLNNFSFIMDSSCGFKILIEANIYQNEIEEKIMVEKVNFYCLLSGLSSLFYIISIYCIILNIRKYEFVLPCISVDCFSINPIWNTYVFLANINLSFKFNLNFHVYSTIIFLCAIKFLYFDFKLLHTYWKKRRNSANAVNFYKQRVRFYLLYYSFVFSFFMFINSIFTNYLCIMTLCILLWIPQIIYNIKTNNKVGYPFIYIISSTIDKLIYPLYFRGFKNNFLGVKDNLLLITINILFVIFTIIILYIQVFQDPRFMLSISINNQVKYDFYRNKQELLTFSNNIIKEECVICLLPIFEKENDIIIEMEDKSGNKNIDEEKIDIDDAKEEINSSNNNDTLDSSKDNINVEEKNEENEKQNDIQTLPFIQNDKIELKTDNNKINNFFGNKNKFKLVEEDEISHKVNIEEKRFSNKLKKSFKNILYILKILFCKNFFSFYKKPNNSQGKPFMLTPCNHVFHTECLEKWLEYKKECPNCRTSMEEYL